MLLLPDPIGEMISQVKRPNGLKIGQVRVPLGVIGIIYEARPNVTADAAGLCIKAGNSVILRGWQRGDKFQYGNMQGYVRMRRIRQDCLPAALLI